MKKLEGFRTILVAVLSIAGVVAGKYGFNLPVEDQAELVTYIMGIAMIGMRLITKKPAGKLGKSSELQTSALSVGLAVVIVLLAGCQSLQAPQTPQTPREAIAAAYVVVDGVADGVRIAKRDGHITSEQRDEYVSQLYQAVDDIALAEEALQAYEAGGDQLHPDPIYEHLSRAQAVLSLIETALQETRHE